ncbi:MAG TPA: hypothetical protein VGS97_17065 [Actinocrinis sp.]|uniref:hypothetical protein n=1 Tax=Actinocrinis sp. TaxID=1920516 RepID=UPI002DDD4357|nr:hypothetical protein [Actinocrinis sp.]HEV2345813.1 hypothetical protein [Actinocrinis sp.]
MNERRDAFYAERDRRTRQCGGQDTNLERPVRIVVGDDAATTRAGQVAALALINMVARVHRRVALYAPAAPLRARSLVAADDLQDAIRATALAINPFLEIQADGALPPDAAVSIGIGHHVPADLDFTLTWQGGRGELIIGALDGAEPVGEGLLGAAAASVLGASALFRAVHDQPVNASTLNPLARSSGRNTDPTGLAGPLDVGHVQVIGAGAVASALVYWAREVGVIGHWDIVDGDATELHNTNRCLSMTAADAGWPDGITRLKATVLAPMIGATPHEAWYDQWDGIDVRPDLILLLANARGVRSLIAHRGEPLLVHATTSARWTAELHRHVPDRDDCPACRLPDDSAPVFDCSTGPAVPDLRDSPDAALPFLSAAAGLLLLAALLQIPDGGIASESVNHWQLDFAPAGVQLREYRHPPREGCTHQLDETVRSTVQRAAPRKWDQIPMRGA